MSSAIVGALLNVEIDFENLHALDNSLLQKKIIACIYSCKTSFSNNWKKIFCKELRWYSYKIISVYLFANLGLV